MSGVDVLAVIDRAFCYAQNNCVYEDVRELDEARAAVVELIEAVQSELAIADKVDPEGLFRGIEQIKLRAALSRVRGAE